VVFLFLIIGFLSYSQNSTNLEKLHSSTENDSIQICPFPTNCGYYKGEIANGKANGKGIAILKQGIAAGNWKENQLEGQGSFEIKDKYTYAGEYKGGLLNGQGTIT